MRAVLENTSKMYKDLRKVKENFTVTLLLEEITISKVIVSIGHNATVRSPKH